MSSASASPMLPLELEREIFEIYALSWPKLVPKLMLVAKCVQEWVEPLLYRIVSIDVFPITGLPWVTVNIMHAVIHQKPPTFFHGAVRHLMLHHSDVYEMILSSCSGVEDLCLPKSSVVEHAWIPLIERLPLRRLCAYFNLFSMLSPANRIFSRLTHLCLMGKIKDTKSTVKALIALLKLTHLSLDGHTFAHKCHEIPELPRSISVVILFRDSPAEWEVAEVVTLLAQDVRFVLMNMPNLLKDWQLGATGGKDYWSAAESFVAKRRTREIDPTNSYMIHDEDIPWA